LRPELISARSPPGGFFSSVAVRIYGFCCAGFFLGFAGRPPSAAFTLGPVDFVPLLGAGATPSLRLGATFSYFHVVRPCSQLCMHLRTQCGQLIETLDRTTCGSQGSYRMQLNFLNIDFSLFFFMQLL